MSADRIRVTVPAEPVTHEVNWDDVRAYLRAKGWESRQSPEEYQLWMPTGCGQEGPAVWVGVFQGDSHRTNMIASVNRLARHEQRHPSAVLRDIARGTEPAGVEPLTEETLAAIENDPGGGADVRRLAAAVLSAEHAEALVEVILGKRVGWTHEQVAALIAHLLLDRSLEDRPEVLALVDGAKRRVMREAEYMGRYEEAGEAMAIGEPRVVAYFGRAAYSVAADA